MKIAVIGTGYVGLVAGACLAENGNDVICVDKDAAKVRALQRGRIPIYEPCLEELVRRNRAEKRLTFTTDLTKGVRSSQIIFVAVGTPTGEDGSADLRHVLEVARQIGKAMNGYKVVVDKSTVPVGTSEKVREVIKKETSHPFSVVSNPEFLKQGAAIDDFMKPDRVVIGAEDQRAGEIMKELYAPFTRTGAPIMMMDCASAELCKYAANAMLATRISFMNEVANVCEAAGAAVTAYDPEAMKVARDIFGTRVTFADKSYDALSGADALAIVTEWSEFREPDWHKIKKLMRTPTIFDGRNLYNPDQLRGLGFTYVSMG